MNFDTAKYLGKATSRAKSDVANKLISMFLHELSRKLSVRIGLAVSDRTYTSIVETTFSCHCAYCGQPLERDRAAVEHLDGMNRYRAGLHIVGNVVVSCKQCNSEKRRDDSTAKLCLAKSGWESFLSHDGTRCTETYKTCAHWRNIYPVQDERSLRLKLTRERLHQFREQFPKAEAFRVHAENELPKILETIYRDGQNYAATVISTALEAALAEIKC